jgi:hypothetical protein
MGTTHRQPGRAAELRQGVVGLLQQRWLLLLLLLQQQGHLGLAA